ncbi:hypothetical protein AMK17_32475 [Streptomyces sp. CB00072]|uniref:hypothetical protein n=1 Tax=Streptomyces sp. CB00072 TaxID=1703928 RepID=UPI00093F68E2|nr:hypothetical protein [Streptomyces sp. CB00072]OKI51930.1 hypothetical protein AMK17_32475 [Streptomyces sp. CB00072]
MSDLINPSARRAIRNLATGISDPQAVLDCWEGTGFAPVSAPRDTSGAQGKWNFSRYAEAVDWSSPEQVTRALPAFERMLRTYKKKTLRGVAPEHENSQWQETLGDLRAEFSYDGYRITQSLRIINDTDRRTDYDASDAALYADAVKVLRGTRNQIERLPSLHQGKQEEDIRDVLTAALGGAFEGQATGESFNGKGKTDILLRIDDRNILIGECKFWAGAHTKDKGISAIVTQLLGYLTRNDRQTALLLFIRRVNHQAALTSALKTLAEDPRCIQSGTPDDNNRHYSFRLRTEHAEPWDIDLVLIPFFLT